MSIWCRLWKDQSGQGLTEYSLLVGVIASIIISLAVLFRTELGNMLATIGAHLTDVASRLA